MALINRVLSILMVSLAVTAAVFSFLLFERRAEFRGRADGLAETVADMVAAMDEGSDTNCADRVNFTSSTPDTPEAGTLGWKAYHEARDADGTRPRFTETLAEATRQARDVTERKNHLADTVAGTAAALGMREDAVASAELKNLTNDEQYTDAGRRLSGHVEALIARDKQMIDAIVATAKVVNVPVDEEAFHSRTRNGTPAGDDPHVALGPFECGPALTEMKAEVARLNDRANDYARALAGVIDTVDRFDWKTEAEQIGDPDGYGTAVTSLLDEFEEINGRLALLDRTVQELNAVRVNIEEAEQQALAFKHEAEDWEQKYKTLADNPPPPPPGPQRPTPPSPPFDGTIMQVDNDWAFVVLDFGRDKMPHDQNEFLVARDDIFIARVRVSKVLDKVSVAEVLPEARNGTIRVGDRVILPEPTTVPASCIPRI